MVLSKKKRAVFGGFKEVATINCTCESKDGPFLNNCDCNIISEIKPGKKTPRGIIGGESQIIQLDVPTLQVFLIKKGGGQEPI